MDFTCVRCGTLWPYQQFGKNEGIHEIEKRDFNFPIICYFLSLKMLGCVLSTEVQGREISQQIEAPDCNGVVPLILSVHSNNDRTT